MCDSAGIIPDHFNDSYTRSANSANSANSAILLCEHCTEAQAVSVGLHSWKALPVAFTLFN